MLLFLALILFAHPVCGMTHTVIQKRRIIRRTFRTTPVTLPVFLVRGNPDHQARTTRAFTGDVISYRTRKSSGLIAGVFTWSRPTTSHHQPPGITHIDTPDLNKCPSEPG